MRIGKDFLSTKKKKLPYRLVVFVSAGSDWSSEHPFDAPELSVTQVGGADHDVVARHWKLLADFPGLALRAQRAPALLEWHQKTRGGVDSPRADEFSFFGKFLP